jgi:hypothetical protein
MDLNNNFDFFNNFLNLTQIHTQKLKKKFFY